MRGKEAAFPARGGTAGAITPQHGFRPAVSPPVVWCGAVAGLHPRGSRATAPRWTCPELSLDLGK